MSKFLERPPKKKRKDHSKKQESSLPRQSKPALPIPLILWIAAAITAYIYLFNTDTADRSNPSLETIIEKVFETQDTRQNPTPFPEEAVKQACLWKDNFVFEQEIEQIPPDDYIKDYWGTGEPRSVEPIVNGLRHGMGHYTFANGVVYGDIPWKHGQKHGTFTLFREDGTIEQTLSYKDGRVYGVNIWFNRNGSQTTWLYLDDTTFYPALACVPYQISGQR
ncbi:MAG: hypothetical protein KDJ26_00030 [Alphaproteobacteria bacterium]|nr:hypothetical protein [Alphaproteobacteria bacterium]MCB9985263.1 hypothetical protein [Micavibrio sp.]HPQ51418.1 hypothetical protein [Alphaproteobacteria bacterium]